MHWAYIAGYFDGEGHVACAPTARGDNSRRLTWYNSHRESLEAMMQFMGCGYIHDGKLRGHQRKPVCMLTINRKTDLLRVIDEMVPYLIIKKNEALRLRQHLIDHVDETRAANTGNLASVDTETLRRWYHDEGLSLGGIAKRVGVTPGAVCLLLERRGIDRRPAGGAHMKGVPKSEETRRRMLEARRKLWADPEFRAHQNRMRDLRKELKDD